MNPDFNHETLRLLVKAVQTKTNGYQGEDFPGGYFCHAQISRATKEATAGGRIITPYIEPVFLSDAISPSAQVRLSGEAYQAFEKTIIRYLRLESKNLPFSAIDALGIVYESARGRITACAFAGFHPETNEALCLMGCVIEDGKSYSNISNLEAMVLAAHKKICPDNRQLKGLLESYLILAT